MGWFLCAIAAMLCWSGSDFFSKAGSRPDDKLSHWKMVIVVGTAMGVHAFYTVLRGEASITVAEMVNYLPASATYILAMVLGYVGLRYIELSVSSPICNSSGALAALMLVVFMGERLDLGQTTAVLMVCAGVLGLGIVETAEDEELKRQRRTASNFKYSKSFIAILFPILYALIDALGTFLESIMLDGEMVLGIAQKWKILAPMSEDAALLAFEFTFLLMAVAASVYVLLIRKEDLQISREKPKAIAALFETAGQIAYVYALAGNAVVAAPIISCYCLFSAIWSHIFLKEKLSKKHYIMIGIAITGIVLLGLFEEM